MKFKLQFPKSQIPNLIAAYYYRTKQPMEREIGNERHYRSNDDDFVRAVTSAALSTTNERLRIEMLTLLRGVNWATASALLHFGSKDRFPILDFRAMEALGVEVPANTAGFYNFELWWQYTMFCRKVADQYGLTMRELDKALWQFSKGRNQSADREE